MTKPRLKTIVRQMGWRVRAARIFKGLSADALAQRVGITTHYLTQIEGGVDRLTADELATIALTLELPLWFFFDVPFTGVAKCCSVCGAAEKSIARSRNRR